MKISAISDVHVKAAADPADVLLCKFLDHPQVRESDYVLLLGDIFDLMSGQHDAYLREFSHIFARLKDLASAGKKVFFFEGNHDVHLEKLFKKLGLSPNFVTTAYPVVEQIEGKLYYFSHGDEHEIDNLSYQRYKKIILSDIAKFAANHIVPHSLLNYIGTRASKKSRKKGARYFDSEKVRDRFRDGVRATTKGAYDFVIGGHSHVKDQFEFGERRSVYLNNGYALKTNTFIFIDAHEPRFIELDV